MKLSGGITDTIGGTPLIRMDRLFREEPFTVYGKLEWMNPGGSAKDRPALFMLREAIRRGDITEESVIVESSSGNLAISLAQLCGYMGLRFICVVDTRTTEQHKKIILALGGEIDLVTEPDPVSGEFLPARLRRVQELVRSIPHAYWTNQYANPDNALAHNNTTMKEIADQIGPIDYLFCGVSSCGTLRGCADYIREQGWPTRIIGVDAAGSVIFGGDKGERKFPGLGSGITPGLYRRDLADEVVYVSDRDCVSGCRELVNAEAVLAGASSGGVVAAIWHTRASIPEDSVCVCILPDRGERYLDTVFNEEWVLQELGMNPSSSRRGMVAGS